ncbi:hypothetical protein [Sphingobium sp. B11D3A]|uniref:hypothetical protein n=1 Tax=Sphingobium sp. B11D3A TaxID=2940574 RepID=UPI002224DDAF|nr:hypothetical protein [Sphingobium sp. B11D3A]MCW2392265.1 hypothetical protein [Sphingobium sp. B11D3A]
MAKRSGEGINGTSNRSRRNHSAEVLSMKYLRRLAQLDMAAAGSPLWQMVAFETFLIVEGACSTSNRKPDSPLPTPNSPFVDPSSVLQSGHGYHPNFDLQSGLTGHNDIADVRHSWQTKAMAIVGSTRMTRRSMGILAAIAVLFAGAAFLTVEPMRWRLPPRFLFSPLEIYREGAFDYSMCMRVKLSPAEANDFINSLFTPHEKIARSVPTDQAICQAPFWPKTFMEQTTAYAEIRVPSGMIDGSSGVLYEHNYLYFWSWSQ